MKQYGYELAENWGIRQADKLNGILLLTAVDDHKVTIRVGYGLEPVVTDAVARMIIEQDLVPHYRQEQYLAGVQKATGTLMQLSLGEFPAELKQALEKQEKGSREGGIIMLAIFETGRAEGREGVCG